MSSRRVALGLAAFALLAGCFLSWMQHAWISTASISSERSEEAQKMSGIPTASSLSSQPALAALDPRRQLQRVFAVLNHNPINFYGRALDQFGDPVDAAEVQGSVMYNTGARSGVTRAHTITDAQGYFQFTDLMGQDLGIGIKKERYEYHPEYSSFSFSYFEADHKRHEPDPKNPVAFGLWKKQGAEPLIHYDRVWRFPLTANPVKINLRSGKMDDEDPDIVVSVSRTPLQMRYGQRGFSWAAIVEVVDGGLIRVGSVDYYNVAPEWGYQSRFEHVQEAEDSHEAQLGRLKWTWSESMADHFYISSHQGRNFAHINLRIRPNSDHQEGDNEALVEAEVWLNPNGSRNLEFDPNQVIPLPRQ